MINELIICKIDNLFATNSMVDLILIKMNSYEKGTWHELS